MHCEDHCLEIFGVFIWGGVPYCGPLHLVQEVGSGMNFDPVQGFLEGFHVIVDRHIAKCFQSKTAQRLESLHRSVVFMSVGPANKYDTQHGKDGLCIDTILCG